MIAEAKGKGIPLGEMVSNGEVKFEARENVWKGVEPSQFPLFQGTKIRTEKGLALVTLSNDSQIEVSPNSLFSLDQEGRFVLSQGSIEFRIPSASEISFKVGQLSISKSRVLQAAKGFSAVPARSEETIGSISIHTNGSVTIKSAQGKLTVTNQDQIVLASLSSKDSITIPSSAIGVKPPVMVAQVGDISAGGGGLRKAGGLLLLAGGGLVAAVGIAYAIHELTESECD
jgi:hypothetical protein